MLVCAKVLRNCEVVSHERVVAWSRGMKDGVLPSTCLVLMLIWLPSVVGPHFTAPAALSQ